MIKFQMIERFSGQVAELVYALVSKTNGSNPVGVRVPPCPPKKSNGALILYSTFCVGVPKWVIR